jgi:hypothetical protein
MKETAKKVKLSEPVDVDVITIKRDDYFTDAYTVDLPLDSTPDHIWQDIFEKEWKSSRHLWDRKLFSLGNKLRLITNLDDLEEKLGWVRQVIDRTNERVDEYNQESEVRKVTIEEETRKQKTDEEAKVERIRETLRKSFGAV